MTTLNPQIPMVNLGNLYINNMQLSWTSTTVITVQQGQARDSTNTLDIVLARPPLNNGTAVTTPFTVTTTVAGRGGVDTGTIAASSEYSVYAIWSSSFSQIRIPPSPESYTTSPPYDPLLGTAPISQSEGYLQANVIISLNATTPVLPFGYDSYRRIGTVTTDSSSHFVLFTQTGGTSSRTVWLDGGAAPGSAATSGSTSYVSIGTLPPFIPATASAVILLVGLTPNAAGDIIFLQPYGATSSYVAFSAGVTGHPQYVSVTVPIGFNTGVPVINYRTTSASDTVSFVIEGYVDQL